MNISYIKTPIIAGMALGLAGTAAAATQVPAQCASFADSAPATAFEDGINDVCLINKSAAPVFTPSWYRKAPYKIDAIDTTVLAVQNRMTGAIAFVVDDNTMLLLEAGNEWGLSVSWSDIVNALTGSDPIGLDPHEQIAQQLQQLDPEMDPSEAAQEALDIVHGTADGTDDSGDGGVDMMMNVHGHATKVHVGPNTLPIAQGWFAVVGKPEIYWSNGTDAYCHVTQPKYVGGPVTNYHFNIQAVTSFRHDGNCPGQS